MGPMSVMLQCWEGSVLLILGMPCQHCTAAGQKVWQISAKRL
jgi:hypothetical protein